jgi:hypothetical protein
MIEIENNGNTSLFDSDFDSDFDPDKNSLESFMA